MTLTADRLLIAAALQTATEGDRARFAQVFGYDRGQLSRWLSGARALPRDVRQTCRAILAAPGVLVWAYEAVREAGSA